jgi:hypothetical protein
MNDDEMTFGDRGNTGRPRQAWLRRSFLVAGVVAAGVLGLAACGSSPSSPGVASAGSTTTTAASTSLSGAASGASDKSEGRLLKYSQCMRAHGISDYPDPSSVGSVRVTIHPGSDLNPHDPQNVAAQEACKAFSPGGNPTPAQEAASNANALKYSQCMQANGIADFPDPNGEGTLTINVGGDIDPNAAKFKAAEKSCESLDTGFNTDENNLTPPPASGQ